MSVKQISIIIPTHERKDVLKRSIAYYELFDLVDIIVCDSSILFNQSASNNSKIYYYHLPEVGFADRILFGVLKSNTPFVCLSADDDFLTISALLSASIFLKQNIDYISVQGMFTQFTYLGNGRVNFCQLYDKVINKQLESERLEERIESSLIIIPRIYSLYRREVFQKTLELASKVPVVTNVEMSFSLVPMIFGKHKELDEFWMARDSKRYTTYNLSGNNNNTVINNYKSYFETDEGKSFITNYGVIFETFTKRSKSNGEDLFMKAFIKYFKKQEEKQEEKENKKKISKSEELYSIFLKLIPRSILYLRRKRSMNKLSFGGKKLVKTSDWFSMKKVIIEHGYLEEKDDLRY